MRSIGLIGGMSWESTALYYQIINRETARRHGSLHSARLHLTSLDFEEVVAAQRAGAWDALAEQLGNAARGLERCGADCVLIATNTMHRVAREVQASISVPLLHIADATGEAVLKAGCRRVSLLGTRYTMEQPFYTEHLAAMGIDCVVPDDAARAEVHRIIFDELCKGEVRSSSRRTLQDITQEQAERGADGVILGCTELQMILSRDQVALPLFDTTALHALAAVDFAAGSASNVAGPRACTTAVHPLAPRALAA